MKPRLLDLFSGVGGFSLALKDVCKTVGYCDIDLRSRRVLKARMNDRLLDRAPVFDDVNTLDGRTLLRKMRVSRVDIVTAGFPCQDVSVMNINGLGVEGKRSILVFEAIRICAQVGASIFVFENSPNLKNRGLDKVKSVLEKNGYILQRGGVFAASDVGAPHERKRLYFIAARGDKTADRLLSRLYSDTLNRFTGMFALDRWSVVSAPPRVTRKTEYSMDELIRRGYLLGNSVVPQCVLRAVYVLTCELLGICESPSMPKKRQNECSLTFLIPNDKTRTPGSKYESRAWATPIATWWKISHVDSSRAARILPNQILYEKRTRRYMIDRDRQDGIVKFKGKEYENWIVNPEFIEWLMGYPNNWTRLD